MHHIIIFLVWLICGIVTIVNSIINLNGQLPIENYICCLIVLLCYIIERIREEY